MHFLYNFIRIVSNYRVTILIIPRFKLSSKIILISDEANQISITPEEEVKNQIHKR